MTVMRHCYERMRNIGMIKVNWNVSSRRCLSMATTSIIKQVVIKDKDALKRFVDINNNENPLK